jgi:purine catabolism regulator
LSPNDHRPLSVADLLELPELAGAKVVAGQSGLDRAIRQVNVMQIPTERFAKPEELLLASIAAFEELSGSPAALVSAIAERGVTAMAIRGGDVREALGAKALRIADLSPLPLIELPGEVHLDELQTRVLKTIVTGQATQLELDIEVRERVASHVLEGGELDTLADGLSEIMGDEVAVFGDSGALLSASSNVNRRHATVVVRAWLAEGWEDPVQINDWVIWPVMAGRKLLGCIAVSVSRGYRPLHRYTLEHGAAVAALQMLHRREVAQAEIGFRAGFVEDLLAGWLDRGSAQRRALAVGWPQGSEFRALLATGSDHVQDVARWLRQRVSRALVTEQKRSALAIVPYEDDARGSSQGDPILQLGKGLTSVWPEMLVGVSSRHSGLEALPLAVEEAREALGTARVFHGRSRVRSFDALGLLWMLAEVPVGELKGFRDRVLQPLDSVGAPYRRSLLETLKLLLECNLNVAETARRGNWHYNTVRSRVARLSELLGPIRSNGVTLDSVSLALVLKEELRDA